MAPALAQQEGSGGDPWSSPALSAATVLCWDPSSPCPAPPGEESWREIELHRGFNFPQTPSPNGLASSANICVAQGQGLLPFTHQCGAAEEGACPHPLPRPVPPAPSSLHQPSPPVTEPGDGLPPSSSHMALTKMLSRTVKSFLMARSSTQRLGLPVKIFSTCQSHC